MKTCNICYEEKPYSEFYRKSASVDGYKHQCKVCTNKDSRARYYANREERLVKQRLIQRTYTAKKRGLTPEDLAAMYERANNSCQICGISEEEHGRALAIDHCHTNGHARGLLCKTCNVGLGNFKDSKALMRKAMDYLDETRIRFGSR